MNSCANRIWLNLLLAVDWQRKKGYAELIRVALFTRTFYTTPSVRSSFIRIIRVATEEVCNGTDDGRAEVL
ncbi:hypothetical protein D3C76_251630 [compost metagenome]